MRDCHNLLILTDLDGTFLAPHSRPHAKNEEAVRRFLAQGGSFSIATGRMIQLLDTLVPACRELVNAPMVLCNGAQLYHPILKRTVCEQQMALSPILPILCEVLRDFHTPIRIEERTGECGVTHSYDDPEKMQAQMQSLALCDKVVFHGAPADLPALRAYLEKTLGTERYAFSYSCPTLLELADRNATKGGMLKRLKEYFRQLGEEKIIYAAGDYENDLSMLLAADISACPENATEQVKQVARVHLVSNEEGAIADLVDRILANQI